MVFIFLEMLLAQCPCRPKLFSVIFILLSACIYAHHKLLTFRLPFLCILDWISTNLWMIPDSTLRLNTYIVFGQLWIYCVKSVASLSHTYRFYIATLSRGESVTSKMLADSSWYGGFDSNSVSNLLNNSLPIDVAKSDFHSITVTVK